MKPTLTVAIPVYSEEATIGSLIASVLKQKRSNFVLQDVVAYTDVCIDGSVEKIKQMQQQSPLVKLREGKKRRGKYGRMDQMFRECTSDILVVLDADIQLADSHVLEEFVRVLTRDKSAMFVQAHQLLVPTPTFIGKVIYTNFLIWDHVRWSLPSLDNAVNFYGSAIALRGSFARTIHIPTDISDPHLFLYLTAAKAGGFRYAKKAVIHQWAIGTIADYRKLLHRSIGRRDPKLDKLFDMDSLSVYQIERKYKIIGLLKTFWAQPLFTPFAILFNLGIHKFLDHTKDDASASWNVVSSTKKKYAK